MHTVQVKIDWRGAIKKTWFVGKKQESLGDLPWAYEISTDVNWRNSSNKKNYDTVWIFNIAMDNGPFVDGLPIKNGPFSMAMLNNQMVYIER